MYIIKCTADSSSDWPLIILKYVDNNTIKGQLPMTSNMIFIILIDFHTSKDTKSVTNTQNTDGYKFWKSIV